MVHASKRLKKRDGVWRDFLANSLQDLSVDFRKYGKERAPLRLASGHRLPKGRAAPAFEPHAGGLPAGAALFLFVPVAAMPRSAGSGALVMTWALVPSPWTWGIRPLPRHPVDGRGASPYTGRMP